MPDRPGTEQIVTPFSEPRANSGVTDMSTTAVNAPDWRTLSDAIRREARELGFDLVGIAPAETPMSYPRLLEWLQQGFAGEMGYIARRVEAYAHPRHIQPDVRSLIVVAQSYHQRSDSSGGAMPETTPLSTGRVATYARSLHDYHDTLRADLKRLAERVQQLAPGCRTRTVVDTAPLLERDFSQLAGLGWFGKNTMLINKRAGSFLLLGALLTDLPLVADPPHATSHCGTCTRCLEACPTEAFVGPHVLDARRCISYLTIELRGSIPRELRAGIDDWLFGCDVCQDVCPWNRKAPPGRSLLATPSPELPEALTLLAMDEATFDAKYGRSPLGRPGYVGLRRNAAIVLGNLGRRLSVEARETHPAVLALVAALDDPSPIVRGSAVWALGQWPAGIAREALQARFVREDNPEVRQELQLVVTPEANRPPCPN